MRTTRLLAVSAESLTNKSKLQKPVLAPGLHLFSWERARVDVHCGGDGAQI